MKKILFNKSRTKFFNLDFLVSVQMASSAIADCKAIVLKFSSEDYFLVFPGPVHLERTFVNAWDNALSKGDYEENKKLYEYFEHKFTRSSLCQHEPTSI